MLTDDLIAFPELARRLPPYRGKRIHSSTLHRWHLEGVRTPDGGRVRLEARRLGRWLYTTMAAIDAFSKALADAYVVGNEQRRAEQAAPPRQPAAQPTDRTPAARRASVDRARRELASAGI